MTGGCGWLAMPWGRPTSLADRRARLPLQVYENMSKPAYIFDGRNILDHAALREIGFVVYAIGKPLDPVRASLSHPCRSTLWRLPLTPFFASSSLHK